MTDDDKPVSAPTLHDRPSNRDEARTPVTRFRAVREIARGGMGRVMEAIDIRLGRTVAVKEILSTHPDARRRFEREIAITARLEHPSIVPLYDAGTSPSGDPYYVMRKLSGAPLDRVVKDATTLDRRLLLLPSLLAVADAVAHAHGRGVIHRDLKPSNVLVAELGETVVIDWGLAKIVGEPDDAPDVARDDGGMASPHAGSSLHTVFGTVVGTPGFMAPEQATADTVDARSDVYALGACLYYLLAGELPIASGSETEVLERTVAGAVPSLAARVPGVPSELVTIVEKAMARDPRARYLDAGGFSEELRRFLGGQLVASHRYAWREQLLRWFRRRRALVIAIAAAVAISTAIGVVSLRRVFAEQELAEAAAARERDRADDLVVTQAQAYLDASPTLAIATLAQLRADSPRWNELRATLAEARAKGVAIGYPGHGGKITIVEAPPGPGDDRILTAGNGEVWLDDLAKRTATRLVDKASLFVRARWCGSVVAVFDHESVVLIDPRTGARTTTKWSAAPTSFTVADGVLVVSDAAGAIHALDIAGGATTPVDVAVDHVVASVDASPTGAWLTLFDAHGGAVVYRRTGRTSWERAAALDGDVRVVRYSAKETRVAYITGTALARDVIELDLPGMTVRRRWHALNLVGLGYVGTALVAQTVGPGEFRELGDAGATTVRGTFEVMFGPSFAGFGDYLVALEGRRKITISAGTLKIAIVPPLDIASIDVHDHFLVGASSTRLVVWDLDDSVPARQSLPAVGNLEMIAPDRLLTESRVMESQSEIVRYAVRAQPFEVGHGESLAMMPLTGRSFALGDGSIGVYDIVAGTATLVDPPVRLATGRIAQIASLGMADHVIATTDGRILRRTGATAAPIELGRVDGRVTNIAVDAGWIAVRTATGAVWRRDPEGRVTTARDIGTALTFIAGTLYGSRGNDVVAWGTGEPIVVASMQLRVSWLYRVAGGLAIETEGGGLALYVMATRAVRPVLPAFQYLAYARDGSIAAARVGDSVVAIDLATGEHWPIIERVEVEPNGIAVTPDGSAVIVGERTRDQRSTLYRVSLVPGAALRDWAHTATNASAPTTVRGSLEFRPLPATVAP